MPTAVRLDASDIPPLLDRLVAESSLFRDIDRTPLGSLLQDLGHRLRLAPGEDLITEGEVADAIYFIENGALEVRKRSDTWPEKARQPEMAPHTRPDHERTAHSPRHPFAPVPVKPRVRTPLGFKPTGRLPMLNRNHGQPPHAITPLDSG